MFHKTNNRERHGDQNSVDRSQGDHPQGCDQGQNEFIAIERPETLQAGQIEQGVSRQHQHRPEGCHRKTCKQIAERS